MRILAFDHSSELGGAEIGLGHLAAEMREEVKVALIEEGPFSRLLRQQEVPHVLLKTSARQAPVARRSSGALSAATSLLAERRSVRSSLVRELDSSDATVLLCNTLRAALLTSICQLPSGIPRVVMLRDGLAPPYLSRSQAAVSQLAVNVAANVIVGNSEWTVSQIRSARPTRVLPPMIGREFFDAPAEVTSRDTVRVLMLGRIARWKGQLFGLDAAAQVRTKTPWEITIAGGPWFGESQYDQAVTSRARSIENVKVEKLGHVDDVLKLIDAHDIILHTSTSPEPFGQIVVQGMARGKLVIASDEGGPSEIIQDRRSGLLYRPRNVLALKAALMDALENGEARQRLGREALKAAQAYHPELTVSRFRRILAELVG
jgi:glycosyltransferase involved in cell wall biosynthesis